MKQINGHGISGPFKNEQDFKTQWIKASLDRAMPGTSYFCIETEETEPGFPDVMKLDYNHRASFYEMKLADGKDKFTLQRTQPLFYKRHGDRKIVMLVWSNKRNRLYALTMTEVCDMVLKKSSLTLNLNDFVED